MQSIQNRHISDRKKSFVSFWFVFALILNGYASGVPGVSLGSMVYVLLILFAVIDELGHKRLTLSFDTFWFGVFFSVCSLVGAIILLLGHTEISVPLSAEAVGLAKFWTWALLSALVVRKYYDRGSLTKWLTVFAFIMTAYIILQSVAYYGFHVYFPNIFRFGPLQPYVEGYADYERLGSAGLLRPAGLLSESSFYGNFIMCATALYLEKNFRTLKAKDLAFVLYLSAGIILSGSTSAIIFQAIILYLYFRRTRSGLRAQVLLAVGLLAVVVGVLWLDGLKDGFIGRTLNYAFDKFDYLDRSTRFGKSYAYLSLLPSDLLPFGAGIGADQSLICALSGQASVYLNSVTALIVQSGIAGCILFVALVAKLFLRSVRKRSLIAAALILTYFVKGFASGIYFSTYGILFMYLIIGQLYYDAPPETPPETASEEPPESPAAQAAENAPLTN